jgi:hypothetical protein
MRILVGAWGTGPFDSDAAEDYVDALGRMSAAQRLGALEETFGRAAMAANDSWRQPGELIAAAAVAELDRRGRPNRVRNSGRYS